MDEEKLFSKNVRCVNPPKMTFFYKDCIYHLKYHRMNDIVWYTCEDNNYVEHTFHENGWQKYFVEI